MSHIIMNWKMYHSYQQTYTFLTTHGQELHELTEKHACTITICPSFEQIELCSRIMEYTNIYIGAQGCSAYTYGPHTGDVSAQSLTELGCTYIMVGHHEQRTKSYEDERMINQKIAQIISTTATPIICIGEDKRNASIREQTIQKQLTSIFEHTNPVQNMIIAYEPGWAVGSDTCPNEEELYHAHSLIHAIQNEYQNTAAILYGGNIHEKTIAPINQLQLFDGYLIGRASTDFKKIKNIVSLISK